jgi:hypothetical protein
MTTPAAVPSEKWQCQFCHKHYQPNYKYKIHLGKCLVFKAKLKNERDVLVDSMLQLREELKKELQTTMHTPLPLPPPPRDYSHLFEATQPPTQPLRRFL